MPECFFKHLGGCEGRLVKAHLVPKSRLKQELRPFGADMVSFAVWDPRCWRWMCGGGTGLSGHHGAYDAKQIKFDEWPESLIEFLREYGVEWMAEAYAR